MNNKDTFKDFVQGEIEVLQIHADGTEELLLRKKNMILNSGSDLVAKAVAGELHINGMYLVYRNGADAKFPVSATLTPADFAVLPAGSGFVRVPTISRAGYTSSDIIYSHNQVQFTAVSDSNPVFPSGGNTITDGVTMFYGAALAFIAPGTDSTKDVLMASSHFEYQAAPIEYVKIAGAQIAVRWTLTFTTP